jgi:hypothetical protein
MYALSKVLVIFVFTYCQIASAASPCQSLNELNWLPGDWLSSGEKTDSHESWQKISEQIFEGQGQSLNKQGKQTSSEDLRLLSMQGEIYYVAKVSHNPLPVAVQSDQL